MAMNTTYINDTQNNVTNYYNAYKYIYIYYIYIYILNKINLGIGLGMAFDYILYMHDLNECEI